MVPNENINAFRQNGYGKMDSVNRAGGCARYAAVHPIFVSFLSKDPIFWIQNIGCLLYLDTQCSCLTDNEIQMIKKKLTIKQVSSAFLIL